jgi:hypothetical protein
MSFRTVMLALGFAGVAAGMAAAADQTIPTKFFVLKDPDGSQPTSTPRKKMKWSVKDGPNSTLTIAGDPTIDGAVVFVSLTNNSQCFELPKEGWKSLGPAGFRYKDPGPDVIPTPDVRGGIKKASIKKTPNGNFILKARAASKTGPIILNLFGGGLRGYLLIRGGDRYCMAGFPTVADGFHYEVRNATAPGSCAQAVSETFCSPSGAFLD